MSTIFHLPFFHEYHIGKYYKFIQENFPSTALKSHRCYGVDVESGEKTHWPGEKQNH